MSRDQILGWRLPEFNHQVLFWYFVGLFDADEEDGRVYAGKHASFINERQHS